MNDERDAKDEALRRKQQENVRDGGGRNAKEPARKVMFMFMFLKQEPTSRPKESSSGCLVRGVSTILVEPKISYMEVSLPNRNLFGLIGFILIALRIEPFGTVRVLRIAAGAGESFAPLDILFDNSFGLTLVMGGIRRFGFTAHSKVADFFNLDGGTLPSAWNDLFPVLNEVSQTIIKNGVSDRLVWKVGNNKDDFASSLAWDSIRAHAPVVPWAKFVWFAQCIPRHAFLVWLIMRNRLLTQDKILAWDATRRKNMNMMCCMLCYSNYDSHEHLFFECRYSMQVWSTVRKKTCISLNGPVWSDIISCLVGPTTSSIETMVAKLVVHAAAYFIWQERNNRIFQNHARPQDSLASIIRDTVRNRLMGIKIKKTGKACCILQDWNISGDSIIHGGVT
ncbi:hypothetical protein SSX86_022921 [Deinandra increscens subsp. villosa]|uniref:Reverse transcriptase zinc-binding domain-containing protein n=1 Tax=Deinandra increscens subsp. villosa TaxID=3103831 RepID=A0AAP0GQR7_9ASTR